MLEEGLFDRSKPLQIRWGDLPHWRQECATYFVTFRLSDSLPQVRLREWEIERKEWREHGGKALLQRSLEQRARVEQWLDRGLGSCILARADAYEIVMNALRFFNDKRYELGETGIAANHVHTLVRTALGIDLSDVLYSWKRFTSGQLRKIPVIRRAFANAPHLWQPESFDHIVRSVTSLDSIRDYIRAHGHENWPDGKSAAAEFMFGR